MKSLKFTFFTKQIQQNCHRRPTFNVHIYNLYTCTCSSDYNVTNCTCPFSKLPAIKQHLLVCEIALDYKVLVRLGMSNSNKLL